MILTNFLVVVVLFLTITSLQGSSPNNQTQRPKPIDATVDVDLFLKHMRNATAAIGLTACDCPPDTPLRGQSRSVSLDCAGMASGEWIPPPIIMPNKPKKFKHFSLRLNEDSRNEESWCSSGDFLFLNVTHNSNSTIRTENSPTILDVQGTLQINETHQISKTEYCVIRTRYKTIFKICVEDTPTTNSTLPTLPTKSSANVSIFVQKCCSHDQVMDGNSLKTCITVTNQTHWFPTYYRDGHKLHNHNHGPIPGHSPQQSTTENVNATNPPRPMTSDGNPLTNVIYGFPTCKSYLIRSFRDNKFPNLQENGDVILVDEKAAGTKKKYTTISAGQFCIDGLLSCGTASNSGGGPNFDGGKDECLDEGGMIHPFPTYSGSEWHQGIIICTPIPEEITLDSSSWSLPLYAAVNHTAALFLLLTAIVYILLWSHQNIHGWIQFCYAVSLFFAFSFLAIVQVWSQVFIENWPKLCFNLGWLIHFSILSSFFWLTSLNYDIWERFSGRRYLRTIRSKPCSENVKKFLCFALFSVGIPVVITGSAVLLDIYWMFDEQPDTNFWIRLPRFGVKKCYFHDKKSQFPFLYLPIGLLLFVNLLFFSSTVVQLRKIHSNTEMARTSSTLEDKKGVRLIAKLFIIMGVLWCFEFISWAASIAFPKSEELLIWIFMPTEIINSLQGIAIFVIFVCKPNVLSQLSAKFGSLRCRQ